MRKAIILLAFVYLSVVANSQEIILDSSFGTGGYAFTPFVKGNLYTEFGRDVFSLNDGKFIVVADVIIGSLGHVFLSRYNADGNLDHSFGQEGYSDVAKLFQTKAAIQKDGKIVVIGYNNYTSNNNIAIVRYNSDGSLDETFSDDGIQITNFGYSGVSLAVQTDNKIIITGNYKNKFALARYNSDGSLDKTFSGDGIQPTSVGTFGGVNPSIVIQKDGKLVVAGLTSGSFGPTRYNPDGTIDKTFSGGDLPVSDIGNYVTANSIAIQEDGKLVVAGIVFHNNNVEYYYDYVLARYNTNGSLDKTFSKDGWLTANVDIRENYHNPSVVIREGGKILLVGSTSDGYSTDLFLASYNPDGILDKTFSGDGKLVEDYASFDRNPSVVIREEGKILLVGSTSDGYFLANYNPDGSLDKTFSDDGRQVGYLPGGSSELRSVIMQKDKKIIAVGSTFNGNSFDFVVIRYNPDGSLDNTFSKDGRQVIDFGANESAATVAIQMDGKIVVSGSSGEGNHFALARLNADGSMDVTFSEDGMVISNESNPDKAIYVAIQKDGKILQAGNYDTGSSISFNIIRYNSNGSFDGSFQRFRFAGGAFIWAVASSLTVQDDGKVIVAGNFDGEGTGNGIIIARYNTDGTLDNTFSGGFVLTEISGRFITLSIQSDGNILVGGYVHNGSSLDFLLTRYNKDGSLDKTFSNDGKQTTDLGFDDRVISIFFRDDKKILVLGTSNDGSKTNLASVVYNEDGLLDTTISNNSKSIVSLPFNHVIVNAAHADDKLYVVGSVERNKTTEGVIAAYLLMDTTKENTWYRDADGDGFGNPTSSKVSDKQPKGYVANMDDCNDKNKVKGGPEVCDGIDNDCNGTIDDWLEEQTFYSDFDGDGYGSNKRTIVTCAPPPRFIAVSGDCNDDNKDVYPGAPELCDGRDNDCNGKIDDGLTLKPFYWDGDKDGYGFFRPVYACAAPKGHIAIGGDCNDEDASIHPGATEHCDGVDEDCNGVIDDGYTQKRFYKDRDGDGWGSLSNLMAGCAPAGYVERSGDCDDYNLHIHPEAAEHCGVDENCDGIIGSNTSLQKRYYKDLDDDGWGSNTEYLLANCGPEGYVGRSGDCNDFDAAAHPEGTEIPDNGLDENCNGLIDEITSTIIQSRKAHDEVIQIKGVQLQIVASPNPSTHYFNLRIYSGNKQPIQLRVVDALGRVIEVKQGIAPNTTFPIGHSYNAGVYFAEVLEGGKRAAVKLIKQSQ